MMGMNVLRLCGAFFENLFSYGIFCDGFGVAGFFCLFVYTPASIFFLL
jgi:hypothetical protein